MENRKKLPLPTGTKQNKRKKNAALALALLLALLLCALVYFAFLTQKDTNSTSAFLSGSFIEIRASSPGKIEYIAKAGQPVSAGELALRVDASEYKQAAKEAEAIVSSKAESVPQRSRELMLRYLSIAQSEAELAESVKQAAVAEKNAKDSLDDFTTRQAAFGLELRRIELKRNKLPEEEARMDAMRVEEELLRQSLNEATRQFETASLERAATEKRLQTKRELGRALRSLPLAQREQLYALETEFHKMYEAEQQIALSSVNSPQSGKVIFTVLAAGDNAKQGDIGLYIIPDGKLNVWVTAYFSAKDAKKMQLGAPCLVTIDDQSSPLSGTVAERMPYMEAGRQADHAPFKVTLNNIDAAQLVGLAPGQSVKVKLGQ